MRSGKLFLITGAGLVSAAFAYVGTGLYPICGRFGWRRFQYLRLPRDFAAALLSFGAIASSIGEMNQCNCVRHEIELPPHITILYFLVPAVVFGFGLLFVRGFIRRGSLFLASLAFPLYWVTCEYPTEPENPATNHGRSVQLFRTSCIDYLASNLMPAFWTSP
jgi:hypothetical protein